MSGQKVESRPKVRLVRCPKCSKLLPEITNVPVYRCGGCNTILQAKVRKNGANGQMRLPAQSNEPSEVSGNIGSGSSSYKAIASYEEGSSSSQNHVKCDKESLDMGNGQLAPPNSSIGEQDNQNQKSEALFRSVELSREMNGVCSSNVLIQSEDEQPSTSAETDSALDMVNKNCSNLVTLVPENQAVAAEESSSLESATERESSSQEKSDQGLEDNSHGVVQGQSQESPANKSPCVYSPSSCDERDDRFPEETTDAYKSSKSPGSDDRRRKEKSPMTSDSEMQESYSKGEPLEPNGNGFDFRNWRSLGTNEYRSPEHSYLGSFSSPTYEVGSPSRKRPDLHANSGLHLPEVPSRQDQLKHMRTLQELQPRWLSGNRGSATRYGIDQHIPLYYSHSEPREGTYRDVSYPRYYGRLGSGTGWSQQFHVWHMPKRECPSCLYSGQLRDPFLQSKGFNGIHPAHHCCNSFSSCSSSPQNYTDHEYYSGWGHESRYNFYDQKHNGTNAKRYLGETNSVVKRHVRPTAGGAPFASCYHCLRTLQLPVDFLVLKSRIHLLKCAGCSKVLTFSLQNRSKLVPTMPGEIKGTTDNQNMGSKPKENGCTDGHPVSYSSSDATKKKSVSRLKKSPNKGKSASPDIEGQPQAKGSPLHQLMGYSSVSQVFKKGEFPISGD